MIIVWKASSRWTCQAFSTAGKREAFGDKRGNVFLTYIDRILELRPRFAVIENVRGLLSAPFEGEVKEGFGYAPKTPEELKGRALEHIIKKLEDGGYSVSFNLYNAANYGSPQKRERVVIICSRDGVKAPYLMVQLFWSHNGDKALVFLLLLGNGIYQYSILLPCCIFS